MGGLQQTQRSALRRSLQQMFVEGTLEIANHFTPNIESEVAFKRSWKTMLCLIALQSKRNLDSIDSGEILSLMKEKRIVPLSRKHTHKHHSLTRGSVKCISKKALMLGLKKISLNRFEALLAKERVESIKNPWQCVLPEDIGSCYEIMMEFNLKRINGVLVLHHRKDRRKSGIVHTPHDLASHMCEMSLKKSELLGKNFDTILAIDMAHGAGAFTLEMARRISKASKMKIEDVFSKCILGFDVDSEVLNVASFCFHIESNFPKEYKTHNLFQLDSLNGNKSVKNIKRRISDFNGSQKIIVIGNPPYVEIKLEDQDYKNFDTRKSRNLSAYFLEQAMKIMPFDSLITQVVPLSLIHSKRMNSLRTYLINGSRSIRIQSYDCVPGYMFDQGKIGSNSNKSITQRIAIIQLTTGDNLRTFVTSKYMRWRGDERNKLFSSVPSIRLNKKLYANGLWPSIGTKEEKEILNQVYSSRRNFSTIIESESKHKLFIPNSTRYFISAVCDDLARGQQIINFVDQKSIDLAQIIINSNFFYWYWRITDGGFSVSLNTIFELKLPTITKINENQTQISRLARKLRSKKIMDQCRVVKSNKGDKLNYKFDKNPNLMSQLDDLIHILYDFPERYQFNVHKSNSLAVNHLK